MNIITQAPVNSVHHKRGLQVIFLMLALLSFGQYSYGQYCTASRINGCDEEINSVNFNTISNSTACEGTTGYTDYTGSVSTTVESGISYPISITNNANPYAGNQVRVFIDWNQNEVFDVGTSEEIILTANVGNTVYSGTVHVPNDALAGETRMRVRQSWNQVPSPCGQQNYGEIEDYAVVVTFPVCPPPLNVMTSNLTTTSVDINFDSVLGDVFVEYGIPPFSPGTDANAGGGLIEGPATSPVELSGLAAFSDYVVYVRQECSPGVWSSNNSVTFHTGVCLDGGPVNIFDSNTELVEITGLGGSGFSHNACAPPGGPDMGHLGVEDLTSLSVDIAEGFSYDLTVEFGSCDGSTFAAVGSVWVDWNSDLVFSSGEVIGTVIGNPSTGVFAVSPPPGTALGPKTMRVTWQEGGVLPLDPCALFDWGSVMDFTVNVVAPPDCELPVAEFELLADCDISEFSIEIDLTSIGDSPGDVVNITNTGGEPSLIGVGTGVYVLGPFTAGSDVSVTVEHLGDSECNLSSGNFGTDCILCTAVGPSSSFDSNVQLVEINGFAGSGFSHNGCPAGVGLQDLTNLEVDIPGGFSYDLTVVYGTCGGFFTGVGSAWVDWNGDYEFSQDELVGSNSFLGTALPLNATYTLTPPPGTPLGPKVMRVMQFEGGVLPLNPCAAFTWGSVMDFTVNVIADPGCLPPSGSVALAASSCDGGSNEFSVDITITGTGDSPGGVVTIHNSFDASTIENAVPGVYTIGPFPSGTVLQVELEHLDNDLCTSTYNITHNCPPPNDFCEDVTPVTLVNGVVEVFNGNTSAATTTGDAAFAANPTVFHGFELTEECNNVTISYCGTAAGVMGNVWINLATACPATTFTAAGIYENTSCGDGNYTVVYPDMPAGIYYVPVMGFYSGLNEPGPYTLNVLSETCPPPPTDACMPGLSASPNASINSVFPTTTSVINVAAQPEGANILDMDVAVQINHTFVGDLTITLTSPCGTTITLMDAVCAGADNMNARFDDEATDDLAAWCALRFGDVMPVDMLSAFDNEILEGNWTLAVTDNAGGDIGTLIQWCLLPTLGDVCVAPQTEVVELSDQSITLDLVLGGCFDPSNYETFDLTWTGGGFANGVTMPYEITGLNPATLYVIDVSANCTVGGSSNTAGVTGTTLNCTPEEVCTYELTLANSDGTGWEGAIARINNGWTIVDYVMDESLSVQTWTVLSCPDNPISLEIVNGGLGSLPSNLSVSLENSDGVQVFFESGPDETVLYSQANGCPDCAAVLDIEFTRLAADLIELTWNNIELPGNVDDIQVIVLVEDIFQSFEIANETFPAGTTSASIDLGGSWAFQSVTVQVVTNCADDGGAAIGQSFTILPACDAADQCLYQINMMSEANGWESLSLEVVLDGATTIPVQLASGTSGTHEIYTCAGGTIEITTEGSSSGYVGPPFCDQEQPDAGFPEVPACQDAVCALDAFCCDNTWDGLCAGDAINHAACEACLSTAPGEFGCSDASFEVILNPSTDNFTALAETDFCASGDGEVVYSAMTCPSCFPATFVETDDINSDNVDVSWTSVNPAGTSVTVYVGLPGFDPMVDPVGSANLVTAGPGVQGPVNVSGLSPLTNYEVIILEDCSGDPADGSAPVAFVTPIANDDCSDVTPVQLVVPDVLNFTGSSVGATDNSVNQTYGAGQAWEVIELIGCAQTVTLEYCGTTPTMSTAFTGISTGCPAGFPDNYLQGTSWEWTSCGDGNPTIVFSELPAGIYYLPIYLGHTYDLTVTATGCEGCTDPLAINYDPEAIVDDGSCIIPACDWPTLTSTVVNDCSEGTFQILLDIGADGDAVDYDVYVAPAPPYCNLAQATPGFPSDPGCQTAICNADPFCCATLWDGACASAAAFNPACVNCVSSGGVFVGTFTGGSNGIDVGDFPVGATIDILVEHNQDANCNQTIEVSSDAVCGCTDTNALNFSPFATEDDGSCIIPDCIDPPLEYDYCYGNNENFEIIFGPTTPGEEVIVVFNQGVIESSTFDQLTIYDGDSDTAPILYQSPAAQTNLGGLVFQSTLGNGLFATLFTDGSVSCAAGSIGFTPWQFDIYCGMEVIYGCMNPAAVNYDPGATVDDGSCVIAPANDDCANAQALTPTKYPATSNALGTLSGASTSGSTACAGSNGSDVFYTFNVPMENHYWVNLNPFGGFDGVVEVLDACDGTVVACEWAPPSPPFCDVLQGGPGFPSNLACQEVVCAADAFCCNNSWDAICAGSTINFLECQGCLSTAPAGSGPVSLFIQNLPAGDYIVRVRDYYGASYLTSTGNFLVNVQYFPTAKVQDNPNNFLFACNQSGFQLEDFVGANPQSGQGALDYEWLIAEQGGAVSWTWQRGEPNYSTRIEWLDMEYGKTYNVYVRILMNIPGEGEIWGVYQINGTDPNAPGAEECTISTAFDVTPTEVRANYTPDNVNGNPYALCDFVVAYNVSESQDFRWRFDPDTDPNNANEIIYLRGAANPSVRLSWVPGLLPGAIYQVAVEVKVQNQWSGYSTVLPIELALPSNSVAIRPQFCNTQIAPNGYVMSQSVCEADNYTFEFTPQGGGTPSVFTSGNYVAFLNNVNPSLSPGLYDVRVKVTQNGVAGDFGPVCVIEILGPDAPEAPGMEAMRDVAETTGVTLYPNPNAGSEVRVELSGIGDGNHDVNIVIYDIYGKQLSTDAFGHEGDVLNRLIRFDENLSMGMYLVHIFVDGEQFAVERLVVK